MSTDFHKLKVKKIKNETEDAVSILFEVPEDLKETFKYQPGQYITVKFDIKGREQRRAYSIFTSPLEQDMGVTVKRVKNGLVSNYVNDILKEGDGIKVMPPMGKFTLELDPDKQRKFFLFAAGSGITPIMSIIKTILEEEAMSQVQLLYGNRNENSVIFKEELKMLREKYAGQFTVEFVLSKPTKIKEKGLGGLFKKAKIPWEGKKGRIQPKIISDFLSSYPTENKECQYFICGPGNMIDVVETTLRNNDIDLAKIHAERFTNENAVAKSTHDAADSSLMKVKLKGKIIETTIPGNKTILDVLIEEKHDPPYSCTSGACSTCIAKLVKGEVVMDACYALDEEEVEEGFILTCQSHPTTPEIEVNYDV